MNSVSLIGRITRDPALRTSSNGKPYVGFTIAVNRFGQQNQTDFISCFAWNKNAENMAHYVKKGTLLGVEGSLNTNKVSDTVTNYFINVTRVQFLENRNKQGMSNQNNPVSFDVGNNSNMNNNSNDMNNNSSNTNNASSNKTTQSKTNSESDDYIFDDDEFEIKWD